MAGNKKADATKDSGPDPRLTVQVAALNLETET
jgi:hypothetical protein